MSDERTTAGIADLLAEEEEFDEIMSGAPTSIRTGIGEVRTQPPRQQTGKDPNAVRYLFNPFEIIDLRNQPTGCGFDYVRNVVFQPVKTIHVNIRRDDPFQIATGPAPEDKTNNPENYTRFARTAEMISLELTNKNGDKGVIEIGHLTGQSETVAADLNTLLFGEEVDCAVDVNNLDHPCPILPNLLERLDANLRANINSVDAETRAVVVEVGKAIRNSINLAITNARTRINEAQKRILDEKNPNRNLSVAEQRCYLALGEEIPNQMPFLTRSAAATVNAGGGFSLDAEALGRGLAAGLQGVVAPVAPQKASSEFTVSEDDVADAERKPTTTKKK